MGKILAEHAGGDHSGSAGVGGDCAQRGDGANRSSFDYCSSDGRFADNFCSDSRVSEQFKGERILARVRAVYLRKMGAGSGDHGTTGNRQHRNQHHCGRYSQIRQYPGSGKCFPRNDESETV